MMTSNELQSMLNREIFLGVPRSNDFGDVIGLIAMICYLTNELKQKKPGVTHYQVIRLCTKNTPVDDCLIDRLAVLCEFLSQGCLKFPNLGIPAKEMPSKINSLIFDLMPF